MGPSIFCLIKGLTGETTPPFCRIIFASGGKKSIDPHFHSDLPSTLPNAKPMVESEIRHSQEFSHHFALILGRLT